MRFVKRLLETFEKTEADKLEVLLKEFLRIDALLSEQLEDEYKTFFQAARLNFKSRKLSYRLIRHNNSEWRGLLRYFARFEEFDDAINRLFAKDINEFHNENPFITEKIREFLREIFSSVKEAKSKLMGISACVQEIRKKPQDIEEWKNQMWEEFGALVKNFEAIRHGIYETLAADKRLEEVEEVKKQLVFTPLFSEKFRRKLESDSHFISSRARENIRRIIIQICTNPNLRAHKIGDFSVFPEKSAIRERIAFFREGGKLLLCEPLYHISSEDYDGRWNRRARSGEIRIGDYSGFQEMDWLWHS